ncbi:MAG TPA: tRNA (adenosine(37)-N6)-threonylcarbamoyltransferase complex transferase subunit TsaD [Clostridiaceae bacterium]|nr:tRNA (adenosine(37)-N6)-threonylcarbamoyltransferase complex transferase subunit TsaD [Clostridiaceae bacterium]
MANKNIEDIIILGIETSCDETSAAVVKNGREVLSNVISSQVPVHQKYGGVVPEIASRKHVELVLPVIDQALKEACIDLEKINAIAVTYGPGLIGALLVGVSAAKALAVALDKPLVGVHHIEGHIAANYLQYKDLTPPFICLVVSGGHSHVVFVEDYCKFEVLGRTRDDAAGEAFDKIARVLDLGYPGGPLIDKLSKEGNAEAIEFPRVYFNDGSLDFSFSGLKTAVMNYVNSKMQKSEEWSKADVAASFQKAVVDVLVNNAIRAAKMKNINKIALAGGVASNSLLRQEMLKAGKANGISIYYPNPVLCTDNAAMIACGAYYHYIRGNYADYTLSPVANLELESIC